MSARTAESKRDAGGVPFRVTPFFIKHLTFPVFPATVQSSAGDLAFGQSDEPPLLSAQIQFLRNFRQRRRIY